MEDTRISVYLVTTIYGRPELTRTVLSYYKGLRIKGAKLSRLVVGSQGPTSRALAKAAGWKYLEAPNEPLAAKWNAGVKKAMELGAEIVMVIDSDTLLTPEVIEKNIHDLTEGGCDAVGWGSLFAVDTKTGRACYLPNTAVRAIGPGRAFGRRVLDYFDGQIYDPTVNRCIEHSQDALFREASHEMEEGIVSKLNHFEDEDPNGYAIVDLKSGTNIWPFDRLWHSKATIPIERSIALKPFGGAADSLFTGSTVQ